MAHDPYIEQRMLNWGRWRAGYGAGGLGFAQTNWGAFDAGDRAGGSAPVLPDGDDAITDQAVCSLDAKLQAVLERHYVGGGTFEKKIADIGCHRDTYKDRLNAGLRGVSAWLTERQRAGEAQRERIESQQRAMSASLAQREQAALEERRRTDDIMGFKPAKAVRVRRAGR